MMKRDDRGVEVSSPFVTILFTDLVGSTSLFDRTGDEAADAVRRKHFAQLREAIAGHHRRTYGVEVDPDEVIVTTGSSGGFLLAFLAAFEVGDKVAMARPGYPCYRNVLTALGIEVVEVPTGPETRFQPTVEQVAELHSRHRLKGLVVASPANPTGTMLLPSELAALARWCEAEQVQLISDEIYALSTYTLDGGPESATSAPTEPFRSILSIPNAASHINPSLLHVLYGMSKDLAAGGLRIGMLHTRNSELWRCMSAMNQFHWIPGPADAIATAMLEDEVWLDAFLAESRQKLGEMSALSRQLFREKGIPFWEEGRAGFFLWVDLRAWLAGTGKEDLWQAEREVNESFTKAGVFLTPGEVSRAETPGWFRVVFSWDEETLREGLMRMFKALGV